MSHKRVVWSNLEEKNTFPFGYCMLNHMGEKQKNETCITVEELDDSVVISKATEGIPLMHSMTCPVRVDFDRTKFASSKVSLAVAALIENTDTGEVMINKRPKYMRTFPSTGQDGKETLLEALHREIREELGLDVSRSECTPFFAWESCYPTLIEHGIVRKQHFVLYYLIKIDNNFLSEQKVVPQKVEVNSVAWITRDHVKKALSSDLEHHDEFKGIQLKDDVYQETTFTISKELQSLNHSYIDYMVDRPRLTTGTYYLLKHWMNK